ncbi:hypothetical protein GCM10023082_12950 [Streptomyces tremellae]|uniref:Uncharacterized protein n=1 Tax=Streptomyces tremellae TaxID=1124239 RepID=A0ABP7ECV7_9ACTN
MGGEGAHRTARRVEPAPELQREQQVVKVRLRVCGRGPVGAALPVGVVALDGYARLGARPGAVLDSGGDVTERLTAFRCTPTRLTRLVPWTGTTGAPSRPLRRSAGRLASPACRTPRRSTTAGPQKP